VSPSLQQRTVFEDASRIARRLPLGPELEALHPGGCFPLVEDPAQSGRALLLGMMVLRPFSTRHPFPGAASWAPASARDVTDWCYDVAGVGGSWPISGGNAVDAFRLALQYGVVDAVLVGARTMAREGLVAGARRGHLWRSDVPLSWPSLRGRRAVLGPAIDRLRGQWQRSGLLSSRRHPAQIVLTRLGEPGDGADFLDARAFADCHEDGTPIEAWVLTSEAGAQNVRDRARRRGRPLDDRLLVASPPGRPRELDTARVPVLLRERLDVRLAEHDGGGVSLEAFARAGAVAQLHLTLMHGRSVRDLVATSDRLPAAQRDEVLATWEGRARLFPAGGGSLPGAWSPMQVVAQEGADAEALVVILDARTTGR